MKKQEKKLELKRLKISKINDISKVYGGGFTLGLCLPESQPPRLCQQSNHDC
ncbi:hypothetical protein [uncultured Dokdonia sp.]|uniref:hypothetical protein n=1 Tax=uncultured Dokdonia sp. TaxID=575653 RepID=UPI002621CFB5|nr:hypothetical protein [uncultured Dokdonia sp.]